MLANCKQCQSDLIIDQVPQHSAGFCPQCGEPFFVVADAQGNPIKLIFEGDAVGGAQQRQCSRCGETYFTNSMTDVPICNKCRTGEFKIDKMELEEASRRQPEPKKPAVTPKPVAKRLKILSSIKVLPMVRSMLLYVGVISGLLGAAYLLRDLSCQSKPSLRSIPKAARDTQAKVEPIATDENSLDPIVQLKQELAQEVALAGRKQPATRREIKLAELIQMAELALAKDQQEGYREVALDLKQALVKDVEHPAVLGLLGEVTAYLADSSHDLKLKERALLLADRAIQKNSNLAYGWRAKIAALLLAANSNEALEQFEKALSIDPALKRDPYLQLYYGRTLISLTNETALAVETLKALLKTHPQLIAAQISLALAYQQQGDYYSAKQILTRELNAGHNHWRTQVQLAEILTIQGRAAQAIEHYRQALRLEPTLVKPRLQMAVLAYQNQQDPLSAKNQLLEVIARYQQDATESERKYAYYHLANLMLRLKGLASAVEYARESLKISPYFAEAMLTLALAHADQGKMTEALQELEQAHSLAPENRLIVLARANMYARAKQPSESLRLAEEISNDAPNSLLALLALASARIANQQEGEVAALLRSRLPLVILAPEPDAKRFSLDISVYQPWNPLLRELRNGLRSAERSAPLLTAVALAKLYGQPGSLIKADAEAAAWLEEAVNLEPNFIPASLALADYYNRAAGRYQRTVQLLKAAPFSDAASEQYGKVLLAEAYMETQQLEMAAANLPAENLGLSPVGCRASVVQYKLGRTTGAKRELLRAYRNSLCDCARAPTFDPVVIQLIMSGAAQLGDSL